MAEVFLALSVVALSVSVAVTSSSPPPSPIVLFVSKFLELLLLFLPHFIVVMLEQLAEVSDHYGYIVGVLVLLLLLLEQLLERGSVSAVRHLDLGVGLHLAGLGHVLEVHGEWNLLFALVVLAVEQQPIVDLALLHLQLVCAVPAAALLEAAEAILLLLAWVDALLADQGAAPHTLERFVHDAKAEEADELVDQVLVKWACVGVLGQIDLKGLLFFLTFL